MMVAYLREFGRIFSDTWAFPLMGWMKCNDVLVLRFEEILEMEEMPEGILTKLGRFLGLGDRKIDSDKFLFRGTLTWSGKLSSLDEYWSEEAENYFRQLGLYEANKYFGY